MTTRCAVFGNGSWGTAFAMILADAGCEVTLWGRRQELVDTINSTRTNPDYHPGIELPPNITATTDPAKAAEGADFTVLTVPSQTLRPLLAALDRLVREFAAVERIDEPTAIRRVEQLLSAA